MITITSVEGTYVGTWLIGEEGKTEVTDLPQGTFFSVPFKMGILEQVKSCGALTLLIRI